MQGPVKKWPGFSFRGNFGVGGEKHEMRTPHQFQEDGLFFESPGKGREPCSGVVLE